MGVCCTSENLCSLHAGVDRLAMSVIWTLDESLEVLDQWFGRTVIHSHHKLHYAQAQAILDVRCLLPSLSP